MADVLKVASCMAENADATCRAIAAYVGDRLGMAAEFVDDVPWPAREALLDAQEIQLCWLCGLPYVWKADADAPVIELCVAPVMQSARYADRPVYFSDVVVRGDSRFQAFTDLRGGTWAYNEPRSHSGYNVVAHHLAQLGAPADFFGRAVESGAHQTSLRMIANGEVDAAAIDSTVLEAELACFPALGDLIRVIDTLGPSPMPPWVVATSLPPALRQSIANVLLGMHHDATGRAILATWGIARFATTVDRDYDAIRVMARAAAAVRLAAAESAA
jgi:phosphonate transport system substrate-binding protein